MSQRFTDTFALVTGIAASVLGAVCVVVVFGFMFMSCERMQKNEHAEKIACIHKIKKTENPDRDLKMCMTGGQR